MPPPPASLSNFQPCRCRGVFGVQGSFWGAGGWKPRGLPPAPAAPTPPGHPSEPGHEETRIQSTYLCLSAARAGTLGDTAPSSAKCLCLTQGYGGRGGGLSCRWTPRRGLGALRAPHEVSEPAARRPRAPGERQRGEGRILATSPQRETAASAPSLLAAGASMCEGASEAAPGRRRQGRRRRFHRKPAWRELLRLHAAGCGAALAIFNLPGTGLLALPVQTPRRRCLPPCSQGWGLRGQPCPPSRGASTPLRRGVTPGPPSRSSSLQFQVSRWDARCAPCMARCCGGLR